MAKKLLLLSILLGFAFALTIPAAPATAASAVKTPYTGVELGVVCADPYWSSYCQPGELTVLPNGKAIMRNVGLVIAFDTSDPRFTGMAVVSFDFQPGSAQVTPINGRITFYPTGIDGYWEGTVSITITPDGWHSQYEAKGYGALDGMIIYGVNRSGSISGVIIEKP
ncbi:MAG: hypothetical protein ACM3PY_04980 [Omnitrophica WOR_2 bacterium]